MSCWNEVEPMPDDPEFVFQGCGCCTSVKDLTFFDSELFYK